MTRPDPDNRQPCCGAPSYHHWEDCPEWRWSVRGQFWYHPQEDK
jgi:hypothetical protein